MNQYYLSTAVLVALRTYWIGRLLFYWLSDLNLHRDGGSYGNSTRINRSVESDHTKRHAEQQAQVLCLPIRLPTM